jgi:hypothetical protein
MGSDTVRRDEPTIPDDAFENFRFPAETDERKPERKRMSRAKRVLLWVAISLAVVAFFALLVNVMLPGPTGRKPFVGAVPEPVRAEKPLTSPTSR